jgi:hypothetical protein
MSTRSLLLLVAPIGGAELFARGYLGDRPPAFHAGAWLLAASLWIATRRGGAWLRGIGLGAGALAALLSLAELLPAPAPEAVTPSVSFRESHGDPLALRSWWKAHDAERRVLDGNADLTPGSRIAWFGTPVELDARGWRRADAPPGGAFRIVVAGGANTFGATQTESERPWPALLAAELDANYTCPRRIAVINAGRPGHTLERLVANFDVEIAPLAPDLLIVEPGVDALDGLLPADDALPALAPPPRASRWLAALEGRVRARAASRAFHAALAASTDPEKLRRSIAARRYRELLVRARQHGIDVALTSLSLAVNGSSPEAVIRFHESVWPEARRLVVANRDLSKLLPILGVAYRATVLDVSQDLDGADDDAFIDLTQASQSGRERLARNAARALGPLLSRPDPGCTPRGAR